MYFFFTNKNVAGIQFFSLFATVLLIEKKLKKKKCMFYFKDEKIQKINKKLKKKSSIVKYEFQLISYYEKKIIITKSNLHFLIKKYLVKRFCRCNDYFCF